jgi:hypothetical protein
MSVQPQHLKVIAAATRAVLGLADGTIDETSFHPLAARQRESFSAVRNRLSIGAALGVPVLPKKGQIIEPTIVRKLLNRRFLATVRNAIARVTPLPDSTASLDLVADMEIDPSQFSYSSWAPESWSNLAVSHGASLVGTSRARLRWQGK